MDELTIWNVTTGQPHPLHKNKLSDETSLETWIEHDPSLIQAGLVMVGRQVQTAAGTIDLLGIDPAGRWVVIEIKKGTVKKETIARAKNYAACISDMDEDELITKIEQYLNPRKIEIQTLLAEHHINDQTLFEKREVIIFLVGIGHDQPLEPLSKALSFKGNSIQVLSFDLFENESGEQIVVRKGVEMEVVTPSKKEKTKKTPPIIKHWPVTPAIERLLKIAADNGIGDDFRLIHEAAVRHGMYPRTYRWSIMYAPPQNKTRCLICLWSKKEKSQEAVVYIAAEAFAEFYPIQAQEVVQILGMNHWTRIPLGKANHFTAALDELFEKIFSSYES